MFGIFKRLGVVVSGFSVAIFAGMILFLQFDFISHLNTPITGFASLLNSMHGVQYLVIILLTLALIILPVDIYYLNWGTSLSRDVSFLVTLELFFFFGLIALIIGFTSSRMANGMWDAVLNAYLFVFFFNLILLFLIFITYNLLIGQLLQGILFGITGRDLLTFVIMSVLENGTILAVMSALVGAIFEDERDDFGLLNGAICEDGDLCRVDL